MAGYISKARWGLVDANSKRKVRLEPHMFTAPVAVITNDDLPDDRSEQRKALFWRTKTRCSSFAEWMELHDAENGNVLWRAEARYCDRSVAVKTMVGKREKTEFLTVVRLYLESEASPRLVLVHRDKQPAGFKAGGCSKSIAVYTLDPAAAPDAASQPGATGARPVGRGGAPLDDIERFDFAALPAGEDVFQLSVNEPMTAVTLAAIRLPDAAAMAESRDAGRMNPDPRDVRTLARLSRQTSHEAKVAEIDGGLDLPLVVMLLSATDQMLLTHEAIDYDVEWPSDYGLSAGECLSSRPKEARKLKATAEFGTMAGEPTARGEKHGRGWCGLW